MCGPFAAASQRPPSDCAPASAAPGPLLPSLAPTLPPPEPALGRRKRPGGDPGPVLGQVAPDVDEPVLGAQVDAVKGEQPLALALRPPDQ